MTIPTSYFATIRRNPFIVGYWRLNEKNGTRAYDRASKYGLNGIYDGTPLPLGYQALIYDTTAGSACFGIKGTDQNVEISDAAPLRIISNITIEAFIVSGNANHSSIIVGKTNNKFANPYILGLSSGHIYFGVGNGTEEITLVSRKLLEGIPYHVVGRLFEGKMSIFIDGKEIVSINVGSHTISDGGEPVYIGTSSLESLSLKEFIGYISEVAIYAGALSSKEIENHFNIARQIVPNTSHIVTFDSPSYS
jgi:hypothetical protein